MLFGLAMDYEVFLVSRMREDYVHGGDARKAVETGFVGSATVVTAAAVIMFSVFAAFVPEGDVNIKPIALGLAVGVFIDAFVVRMTLVPAVLHLLGDRAWHMPRWLDRLLPSFDVEGEGLATELALADWPEPGADDAVSAGGLRVAGQVAGQVAGPVAGQDGEVDLRVPAGGVLVVEGPHRSGRTALLLTLAGRLHPAGGRLKVDGLVLPLRAADVRRRVAFVRLATADGAADPVGEVRAALVGRPRVLVVDDLDAVTDPGTRAALAVVLRAGRDDAARAGRALTLVASCLDARDAGPLLPDDGAPPVLLAAAGVPALAGAHAAPATVPTPTSEPKGR